LWKGIKICPMAGRSLGKHGIERKGKSKGVLCGKLACSLLFCVSMLSLMEAKMASLPAYKGLMA
jgi:hypothetical protein